jgi:hypothetical protein
LESTNLDQVVELSNSQFNPPCSIESFDSKVDPTSKKKKTNVKKPPKKGMITNQMGNKVALG